LYYNSTKQQNTCTFALPLQIGPDHVSSAEWFQKLHVDDLVTLSFATAIMSGEGGPEVQIFVTEDWCSG
jgi:hypothetical protein